MDAVVRLDLQERLDLCLDVAVEQQLLPAYLLEQVGDEFGVGVDFFHLRKGLVDVALGGEAGHKLLGTTAIELQLTRSRTRAFSFAVLRVRLLARDQVVIGVPTVESGVLEQQFARLVVPHLVEAVHIELPHE